MIAATRSETRNETSSAGRTLHVEVRKRHVPGRGPDQRRFQLEATLTVAPGVTVIVGRSGAGKSTLLRCIAGLSHPEEGRIIIGDRVLFDSQTRIRLDPARRGVAFVFQDLALFPHLTVEDNILYGVRRMDTAEQRMREIMASFQIEHLAARFPREISGGEQQRVALARSLVTEPKVLLLDEPLSSLDPRTKVLIIDDLRRWNETRRIPVLYVTHDHDELLALGDRAVVLERGKIVTQGLPLDVISNPFRSATPPGERFENAFDATVIERRELSGTMVCELIGTAVRLEVPLAPVAVGSEVCVGIHADDILLTSAPPAVLSNCNVIRGALTRFEQDGARAFARVLCGAAFRVHLASRSAAPQALAPPADTGAADVWMLIATRACHLIPSTILDALQRLFVFVCHGNTMRSPMAQAMCNLEIAARLGVPLESLDRLGIKAVSAGLTAEPGQPIAAEAEQALGTIGMPALEHRARNLTRAIVQSAEAIFCMTEQQRAEVTAKFPEAAAKTHRLHPDADVGDAHGRPVAALSDLARQLQGLIGQTLDDLGIGRVDGAVFDRAAIRARAEAEGGIRLQGG